MSQLSELGLNWSSSEYDSVLYLVYRLELWTKRTLGCKQGRRDSLSDSVILKDSQALGRHVSACVRYYTKVAGATILACRLRPKPNCSVQG